MGLTPGTWVQHQVAGMTMQYDSFKDVYHATYGCGHLITIPGTALAQYGTSQAVPSQCPTCYQHHLGQKWVHQQEAKLWNADPNWSGFPVAGSSNVNVNPHHTAASAATSAHLHVGPTGPLAWLDFQVTKVCRRAFAPVNLRPRPSDALPF